MPGFGIAAAPAQAFPNLVKDVAIPQGLKMKNCFWEKIKDPDFNNTIWTFVENNTENFGLSLQDFVETFEDKKIVKAEKVEEKQTAAVTVDLINDDKRTQQVLLGAKKYTDGLKLSYEDIRKMVMSLDDGEMGYDVFLNLKDLAPKPDEIPKLKDFKGDPTTLDSASRWLFEMLGVPIFATRISMYGFMKEFEADFNLATERIETIEQMVNYFLKDKRFLAFMKCCLDVGNTMNAGTRLDKAKGFKFASIKSFGTCKSANGQTYLLPYLITKIIEQNENVMEFYPEMNACLNGAVAFDMDDVTKKLADLNKQFKELKVHIDNSKKANPPDLGFVTTFEPFWTESSKKTEEMAKKCEEAIGKYLDMCVKLGDVLTKIKPEKSSVVIGEHKKTFAEIGKFYEAITKQKAKEKKEAAKKQSKTGRVKDNT